MADVKKLLDRVKKLDADKEQVKADVAAAIVEIKKQHADINEKIQACTRAAADADDKVKAAVTALAVSGVTAEAVADLEIARQAAQKARNTEAEVKLRQESAALEDPLNDLENALSSIK